MSALNHTLVKWGLATRSPKKEIERKFEDLFLDGLSLETTLELQRHSIFEVPAIITKISEMEEVILKYQSQKTVAETTDSSRTQPKWCSFDQFPHHSNRECRKEPAKKKYKSPNQAKNTLNMI